MFIYFSNYSSCIGGKKNLEIKKWQINIGSSQEVVSWEILTPPPQKNIHSEYYLLL